MQLDLGPGSTACPTGCEEDRGWGAVGTMLVAGVPLLTGFAAGKLAGRAVARRLARDGRSPVRV
jgi:hypothetical protein